jgi:lysophospholipase L1-like esterase
MNIRIAASCLSAFAAVLFAGAADAGDRQDSLALGDSVVFGYITQAGHAYVNADNFIGSPSYVGEALHMDFANAGCPGETSGSLAATGAVDHGCQAFRSLFPLHVAYGSSQLAFAKQFLARHPRTRLVTLGVGANDLLVVQDGCAADANPPQCLANGLPSALATLATNIATTIGQLRAAGYAGPVIVANYYSPDYSDAQLTGITALLNQAIAGGATPYGAVVADVFSAFQKVASDPKFAGKTCNTGLLNVDPQNTALCDIHPTQTGQQLIARTITRTYLTTAW